MLYIVVLVVATLLGHRTNTRGDTLWALGLLFALAALGLLIWQSDNQWIGLSAPGFWVMALILLSESAAGFAIGRFFSFWQTLPPISKPDEDAGDDANYHHHP